MRMSKEQAEELRNATHRSDDAIYHETQIEEFIKSCEMSAYGINILINCCYNFHGYYPFALNNELNGGIMLSHNNNESCFIDHNDIPKTINGRNDWRACVGKSIHFQYGDITGQLKIIDYNPKKTLLLVAYKGAVSKIYVAQLIKGQLGNIIGAINHNHAYRPGDIVHTKSGNIKIIEQLIETDNKGWRQKAYRYQCLQCGHIGKKLEGSIRKHTGCEACTGIVVTDKNCIAHTSPEIVQYLVNPKDGFLYSRGSVKKVRVRCPDCNNEFMVSVSKLVSRGLKCQFCGDGVSVPEKYAAELLSQIENQTGKHFSRQVKFDWSAPLIYDFVCAEDKLIIETHGIQHYNGGFHTYGARSLQEEQANDIEKAYLATSHGYHVLVVDCRYSEYDFLMQAFKTSALLQELYPQVSIDYDKCFARSQKTLVRDVADLYNEGITRNEIAKKLDIGATTTSRYLRRATDLGWCSYDPHKEMRKSAIQNSPNRKVKVRCNETGEVFETITEAAKWCGISVSSISVFLKQKRRRSSAGKHPKTGQKLTWSIVKQYDREYKQEKADIGIFSEVDSAVED